MSPALFRRWAPVAAASALCACATVRAPGGERGAVTVEADGWAASSGPGDASAPRRAVLDALRRALEEAAGVRVVAATSVESGVAVQERVRAEAEGVVERYEILSQGREADGARARVRAVVARADAAGARPPSVPPPGAPAVVVRVAAAETALGAQAEAGLRRALSARGFAIEAATAAARGSVELRGDVSTAQAEDARLGRFRSVRARLSVQVVEPATGAVLASAAREAAALDLDPHAASLEAVDQASSLAGGAAADALSAYLWKRL